MARPNFIASRFKALISNPGPYIALVIFLCACPFVAAQEGSSLQTSSRSDADKVDAVSTIEGTITNIQDGLIQIGGGVTIDASRAVIIFPSGSGELSSLTPGMRIQARVNVPASESSPLIAGSIEVIPENELIITGALQDVDNIGRSIKLLNLRISTSNILFIICEKIPCALKEGRIATVKAHFSGTELIADQIALEKKKK